MASNLPAPDAAVGGSASPAPVPASSPKPPAPTPKPAAPTPKPAAPTPKPTATTPKPAAPTPKPTATTPKPPAPTPKTPPTPAPTPVSEPEPEPEPTPTPEPTQPTTTEPEVPQAAEPAPSTPAEDEVPRPPVEPSNLTMVLDEKFVGGAIDPRLLWYNPPANWGLADSGLVIYPDKGSDFWRKTHYGFERDNGHYLYMPASGDFTATAYVSWKALHEYDQAGLMIRLNESCWLKTSIEHQLDGQPPKLGVVVTNYGYSDWSTQNWHGGSALTLRVRRAGSDYFVDYWSPKQPAGWVQLRIAHLFDDDGTSDVLCGIYACSPTDAGYEVIFEYLKIEASPTKSETPASESS